MKNSMRQVKTNIDRPQVSSDEIKERQDFEALFSRYKELNQKPFYKRYWMLMVFSGILVAGGTYYMFSQPETLTSQQNVQDTKKTEAITDLKNESLVNDK